MHRCDSRVNVVLLCRCRHSSATNSLIIQCEAIFDRGNPLFGCQFESVPIRAFKRSTIDDSGC